MRKMKPETKRILAGGLALLLVLIFIMGMFSPFLFGAETNSIEISAQVGIDGSYLVDSPTPVNIIAANSGGAFSGEIQIKLNISRDNNPVYILYSYPLELSSGASKSFTMDISIPSILKSISIQPVSADGRKLGATEVPVKATNTNMPALGVFCDSLDNLNYIMGINYYNNYYGREVPAGENSSVITAESFPKNLEEINAYSIIVINDFDTSALTEQQTTLLYSWVVEGGRLIIGTGQNYEKVKSGLNSDLLFIEKTGNIELTALSFNGFETLERGLSAVACEYDALDVYVNMSGQSESLDIPAALSKPSGLGDVVITTFDLGTWPASESMEMNFLLYHIISDKLSAAQEKNTRYNNYYNDSLYYTATGELKRLDNALLPLAFVLLFIYIVAISPLLYFILKKLDKRDFSWIIIPSAAFAVILLMFGLSSSSGYRKPVLNALNVVKLSGGQSLANINSTVGVFSPKKGDLSVSFDNGKTLKPAYDMNQYNYYSFTPSPFSSVAYTSPYSGAINRLAGIGEGKNIMKLQYGANKEITYYDKASWSPEVIRLSHDAMLGELKTDVSLNGNNLTGTIENNTPMDFDEVVVGFGATYFRLGALEKGEVREINEEINVSPGGIYNFDVYSISDSVFPFSYGGWRNSSEEDFELSQKRTLFQHILQLDEFGYGYNYGRVTNKPMTLSAVNTFAFNTENLLGDEAKVNQKKVKVISHNVFYSQSGLSLSGSFTIPYGVVGVSEVVCDTKYDDNMYDNSIFMYGEGDISFVFELPKDINIHSFMVDISREMGKSAGISAQIYNVKNDDWEPLNNKIYETDEYVYNSSLMVKYTTQGDAYIYKPAVQLMGGE